MSVCKHGVDFMEYTNCSQCDDENILNLENLNDNLIDLLDNIKIKLQSIIESRDIKIIYDIMEMIEVGKSYER